MGPNVKIGVYSLFEGIKLSEEQELDLVEISPNATPPVCKILNYKKFLYEQKKREKSLKSKATKVVVKEIRFGPNTDEHDYEFKKKHAEKFLKEGAKLKAFVFFKGRSIIFKEQGICFPNVLHWSDYGVASWFDISQGVSEIGYDLGLITSPAKLIPVKSDQYPQIARRPAFSLLDISQTIFNLKMEPRYWRCSLGELLKIKLNQ